MVTHNPELAQQYADRIIRFSDGKIIDDSHPHKEGEKPDSFQLKRTSMKLWTALRLSFNNLRTKKGRTFLTAFASSIGIIGIAVVLSLSNGFQSEIDKFQSDAMAEFPVIISRTSEEMSMEEMQEMSQDMQNRVTGNNEYADTDGVVVKDSSGDIVVHTNDFSQEFLDYLQDIPEDICQSIGFTRIVGMNLVQEKDGAYTPITLGTMTGSQMNAMSSATSMDGMGLSSYPESLKEGENYLESNYELVAGEYPESETDLVLVVDTQNRLEKSTLEALGFEGEEDEVIRFDQIVGTQYRVVSNNDYYQKTQYGSFVPSSDYRAMYESENSFPVTISGVVRPREGTTMSLLATGIAYSDRLSEWIIENNLDSEIVKAQQDSDVNVMTLEELTPEDKENMLAYLGGSEEPFMIMLYPRDFETKAGVISYLDDYNEGKADEDVIVYTDLAGTMSNMTEGIMDGVTIVLIAFAAISLVVSMIMICIITYTSVLERTKEIGILRALGARKKDITRVFDAETLILGVFSGVLGVVIAWLCTFPINHVIYSLTGLESASHLRLSHAVLLVIISTLLTVLGGHIPAKMASRKDAVEALRAGG